MKLTVFQSDKGDCLLVTTAEGRRMLVDGGMGASFSTHVAPALSQLRAAKKALDVVYLSHIDEDHIAGILQLMDDTVDWRVHKFQMDNGNPSHPPPKVPQPPEIKAIWHNAFHELVAENAGEIENILAASAAVLSGHTSAAMRRGAEQYHQLATSQLQAIQLARRVGAKQLGIPLNQAAQGKLMMVRDSKQPVKLGTLKLFIIGPSSDDLEKLREEWDAWLKVNTKALDKVRQRAKVDEDRLASGEIDRLLTPLTAEANVFAAEVFGNRKKVTTPNLASLMFLAEEPNGGTVLLTGDGHWEDILKGLDHYGKLSAAGGLHVNVLKVQHHGSEHNIRTDFTKAITADDYIFCGNGSDENPDLGVVEMIIDSRLGGPQTLSKNPEVGKSFKLWFNSRSTIAAGSNANLQHMKDVEALVLKRKNKSGGKLKAFFLEGSSFEVAV